MISICGIVSAPVGGEEEAGEGTHHLCEVFFFWEGIHLES